MGNSHSDRYHNRSLVRFAKQMSARRRELYSSHLRPSTHIEAESWRLAVIDIITHLERKEDEDRWVDSTIKTIYEWDASLDIRWRENVKWFLVNSVAQAQDRQDCERRSKWAIPGVENSSIFKSSTFTDFLEQQLRLPSSHGIAFIIDSFVAYFLKEYDGNPNVCIGNIARMRKDISDFSTVAAEAFRLYYGNISIVDILHKPESFLLFLIRSRIFEHDRVGEIYIKEISAQRATRESVFQSNILKYRSVSLRFISSEAKEELVEIADSTGFSDCIEHLPALVTARSLKDKLEQIDLLQKATVEEIDRFRAGKEPITLMADDMLGLFVFFLLRADAPAVGSHIELLTELIHFDQMDNLTGFCLATLEASLLFVERDIKINDRT